MRIVAVGRGPNVDEHEVEIGTEQEGLAVEGFDARRFGIARQQFECLVGLGDAFVAGIPIVEGRVEVVLVVVFPKYMASLSCVCCPLGRSATLSVRGSRNGM